MAHRNDDDEEDDGPSRLIDGKAYPLARRALMGGERVYQPPDGSPAVILKPGQQPPAQPQASTSPPPTPPPPIYDGRPWVPPVQPWEIEQARRLICTVPYCQNKRGASSHTLLCKAHRKRWEQYGDVGAIRIPKPRMERYLKLAKHYMAAQTPRNQYGHLADANVQEAIEVMRGLLWVESEPPPQFNRPSAHTGKKRGATSVEYLLHKELRRLHRPPMVANKRGVPRGGEFPVQPDPRGPLEPVEALTYLIAWWLLLEMEPDLSREAMSLDVRNTVIGRSILTLRKRTTNGRNPTLISGSAMRLLAEKIIGYEDRPGALTKFLVNVTATVRVDEQDRAERKARLNAPPAPPPRQPAKPAPPAAPAPAPQAAPSATQMEPVATVPDATFAQWLNQERKKEEPKPVSNESNADVYRELANKRQLSAPPPAVAETAPVEEEKKEEEAAPALTPEQRELAMAPWTRDDMAAWKRQCAQGQRGDPEIYPERYSTREITNFIRARRGVPLLPPDAEKPPSSWKGEGINVESTGTWTPGQGGGYVRPSGTR